MSFITAETYNEIKEIILKNKAATIIINVDTLVTPASVPKFMMENWNNCANIMPHERLAKLYDDDIICMRNNTKEFYEFIMKRNTYLISTQEEKYRSSVLKKFKKIGLQINRDKLIMNNGKLSKMNGQIIVVNDEPFNECTLEISCFLEKLMYVYFLSYK